MGAGIPGGGESCAVARRARLHHGNSVWWSTMGRRAEMCSHGRGLIAVLLLGSVGVAAGSGDRICNMPETGTLQAGAGAPTTANPAQIRCASGIFLLLSSPLSFSFSLGLPRICMEYMLLRSVCKTFDACGSGFSSCACLWQVSIHSIHR